MLHARAGSDRRPGDLSDIRSQVSASRRPRRARDPLPAQMRFGILQRDGFRCRYCGGPGTAPGVVLHVDHVILVTACEECNLGKAPRALAPAGS